MSTLTSILYDKRSKKYLVMAEDSTGLMIVAKRQFDTQAEAETFLEERLGEMGLSPGEEIPTARQ